MQNNITKRTAVLAFLSFAAAYFLSNVVRAITATLSPALSADFDLSAGDLGLLAGGYFLGFAAMQLPLGSLLDRFGSRRVLMGFVLLAALGCVGFAVASNFAMLLLSRVLIGVGVCACLMAPMAAYRRWFSPEGQLRSNSWMLMTGALGMLSSTLPVQWLLPMMGWRGIFLVLGLLFLLCIAMLFFWVPRDRVSDHPSAQAKGLASKDTQPLGLSTVATHPYFVAVAPLAFLFYGGYSAMQTLWVGPWLTKVVGLSAASAAQGLFMLNVVMLLVFLAWGFVVPKLKEWGWSANRVIAYFLPVSLAIMLAMAVWPHHADWRAWAAYLAFGSALSLAQPSLAMHFDAALAGRALTLFNLMIFSGSFFVQWFFGLGVDFLRRVGYAEPQAFQGSLVVFSTLCVLSYLWFVLRAKIRE